MDITQIWNQLFTTTLGTWGSPIWYVVAACVVTVFAARWARAIRTLLPFLGAFSLLFMIVWVLVNLHIITITI